MLLIHLCCLCCCHSPSHSDHQITFTKCRFYLDHIEATDSRRGSQLEPTPDDPRRGGYISVSDLVKAHQTPSQAIHLTGFVDRFNMAQ